MHERTEAETDSVEASSAKHVEAHAAGMEEYNKIGLALVTSPRANLFVQ
jgi:hypothetical protein